jgi:serine/threonine-protein kinase
MVDQLAPDDLVDEALSTEELKPGTRLGRYELLLAIAKGGMARVWAARQHGQRGFSKTVAIKTILPHLAEEPEFERMFLDEARIAAMIHHPNVCEIYELGEEGKVLYLAMEWVNGESLVHILRSSGKMMPMEPRLCARIVADACAGLHAAHQLTDDEGRAVNVVHRDVSPHNILVGADGNVKVADFGVAKALGQMHSATVAGQVKGKIAYMSPEQIAGAPADRRIDVFAMGVVLYEATTGRRPFTGEGDPQVMHAIMTGQFTPPSRLIRGYPQELEHIVLTAMAQDPNGRYATSERMRIALEEWLARSGPLVTQSNVGQFVHQRVGNVLDRRRDRIRAAANAPSADDISGGGVAGAVAGTPSAPQRVVSGVHARGQTPSGPVSNQQQQPVAHSDQTGPSIVAARVAQPPAPSAAKYVLAAAIGVSVVAGLGAVGIIVARNRAMHDDVPVPTSTHTPVASVIAPSTTASASAIASSSAAPSGSPNIELRGLPDVAIVWVDGKPLAAGVRQVPRPAHGATNEVVVKAPGFADETIKLDETTASSLEVALTLQQTTQTASPNTNTNAVTQPTGTASSKKNMLPENPY